MLLPLRGLGAALAIFLVSCYQPELVDGQFTCTSTADCPDDFTCTAGRCRGGAGGTDLGGGEATGCKGSGQLVAPSVWACKGAFERGKYAELCQSGYHVCKVDADVALLAAVTRCDGGFFGALLDISTRAVGDRRAHCPPANEESRAIPGCGSGSGSVGVRSECGALDKTPALRSAIICGNPFDSWECSSNLNDARAGSDGGVLCCKG